MPEHPTCTRLPRIHLQFAPRIHLRFTHRTVLARTSGPRVVMRASPAACCVRAIQRARGPRRLQRVLHLSPEPARLCCPAPHSPPSHAYDECMTATHSHRLALRLSAPSPAIASLERSTAAAPRLISPLRICIPGTAANLAHLARHDERSLPDEAGSGPPASAWMPWDLLRQEGCSSCVTAARRDVQRRAQSAVQTACARRSGPAA
jgi:hypothetical protein